METSRLMGLIDLKPIHDMVRPFHESTAEMGSKLDEVLTEMKRSNELLTQILESLNHG